MLMADRAVSVTKVYYRIS